jgi:hypothetical protein
MACRTDIIWSLRLVSAAKSMMATRLRSAKSAALAIAA